MKPFTLVVSLVIFSLTAQAQEPKHGNGKDLTDIISFRKGNEVLLRWTYTGPDSWRAGAITGYYIERSEKGKNVFTRLNKTPLKPNLNELVNLSPDSDETMVIGLSLPSADDNEVLEGAKRKDFSYALYMIKSCYSFRAAELSGTGFRDTLAAPGIAYEYRIFLANTPAAQIKNIRSREVSVLEDGLAAPPALSGNLRGKDSVDLKWDGIAAKKRRYQLFSIEKSPDGEHFEKIKVPEFLSFLTHGPVSYTVKSDSDGGYYRIQLINAFGMRSAYSNTIFVKKK